MAFAVYPMDIYHNIKDNELVNKTRVFTGALQNSLGGHAVIVADSNGNIQAYNDAASTIYGYKEREIIQKEKINIFFPDDFIEQGKLTQIINSVRKNGCISVELEQIRKNREIFQANILFIQTKHAYKKATDIIEIVEDISHRHRVDEKHTNHEEQLSTIIQNSAAAMIIVDGDGVIRFLNIAAARIFGCTVAELSDELFGYPLSSNVNEPLELVSRDGKICMADMTCTDIDWEGKPAKLVMLHDITSLCYKMESFRNLSQTDELTGLANRRAFISLAEQQLKLVKRFNLEAAIIYVDVDHMKYINDNLGHFIGDKALIDTAAILRYTFRDADIIARIGGDEFVIFLTMTNLIDTKVIVDRLNHNIADANSMGNRGYTISLSIGMKIMNHQHDSSLAQLLQEADAAMYEHKRAKQKQIENDLHIR